MSKEYTNDDSRMPNSKKRLLPQLNKMMLTLAEVEEVLEALLREETPLTDAHRVAIRQMFRMLDHLDTLKVRLAQAGMLIL